MKVIKVKFVDFWTGFDSVNNLFYNIISQKYILVISEDPEYLFYSVYGSEHINYECVKILYSGENLIPDFNLCDYAISSHFIDFGERHVRIPNCIMVDSYKKLRNKDEINDQLSERKLCNFIYSNLNYADPFRVDFLEKLSKYKKVDCGGIINNNIGQIVKDKISFISNYKFTIAFENSSVDGYITEKLVEPMSVKSIPIYWGSNRLEEDFNEKSIIYIKNKLPEYVDDIIKKIKFLDNNKNAYMRMLNEPWIKENQYVIYENILFEFLDNIFLNDYTSSKKVSKYGYNLVYTQKLKNRMFFKVENRNIYQKTKDLIKSLLPIKS